MRASGTQATNRPSRQARLSPSAPAKKERPASACLSFFVATGVKPRHAERVGHRRRSAACGGCRSMRKIAFAIFLELAMPTPSQSVGDWQGGPAAADRAGYRKRACEASSSPSFHFRHVMEDLPSLPLLYSSLSHPPSSVLTRSHPLQHPKRTRFCLFWPNPGAFSLFFPFFDLQNFPHLFCSFC